MIVKATLAIMRNLEAALNKINAIYTDALANRDASSLSQIYHTDARLLVPDGEIVLLTRLYEGQNATVLTLPTQPKTAAEAEAQQRVAYVG